MKLLLRFPLFLALAASPALAVTYDEVIAKDKPIAHWNFNPGANQPALQGGAELGEGPRPPAFPQFTATSRALSLHKPGASIRVPDTNGIYSFKAGSTITLEAWVQCDAIDHDRNIYIVGKGRTGRAGMPPHNQNWGFRLRESDGQACVSFTFRDERNASAAGDDSWHRWTSSAGFMPGPGWHHVAISYTFGQPESARGWLDGTSLEGKWDMGGATTLGPWVDSDEVWVGTSMNGSAASSFRGRIAEVAIYKTALTPAAITARWGEGPKAEPVQAAPIVKLDDLPKGSVRVEILEHTVSESDVMDAEWTVNDSDSPKTTAQGTAASWSNMPKVVTETWTEPAFALAGIVPRYSPRGVRRDRSIPFLVRLSGAVTLPPGDHRFLVRAMRGGRLSIDGKIVATSEFFPKLQGPTRASDAETVPDQFQIQLVKEVALLPAGHSEAIATLKGDGKPHLIVFETFVGGKNIRPELGQPSLSISTGTSPFHLVTPSNQTFDFTDDGWKHYAREQQDRVAELSAQRRANAGELAYWKTRHDLARAEIAKLPAVAVPEIRNPPATNEVRPGLQSAIRNPIDAFITEKLAKASVQPAQLIDDATFLRRVTLDCIGLVPTPEELAAFIADTRQDKRARAIERLVLDKRSADQWMPYWQDVLAENPAILKATLNNTGPFRFFLDEALRDNWSMDRFVTALVSMEGSSRNGGAAGFAIASQNDLPMANKAQIVSSAFLAMQMKCARCHDAPNHPFDQADLFAISAMLQREPVKVPGSSLTQGLSTNSHVVVSLKPGQKIEAHWPFADLKSEPLTGVVRNAEDSRERLAAIVTDPRNERFSQVMVNRVWKRLFGWGIVDPVDDWESVRPSHPELLTWLGRELATHDYDLKYVTKLMLNSDAYQRAVSDAGSKLAKSDARLFASQARRRLSAEQLVDSLYAVAGKEFDCEELNFDLDGRRSVKDFINFGVPRRAWEFVGLSNERDRPALAKPGAQVVTDVLLTYGWRESRAEPRSIREEAPNVLQPALLANGVMGTKITRLSDDSAFTAIALRNQPVEQLVAQLFQRVLSRTPDEKEKRSFTEALSPGYATRLVSVPASQLPKKARFTKAVMWSNHLNPDATTAIYESEKIVRAGDPATPRLVPAWRERMEDAVWALMLTPEFTYVP